MANETKRNTATVAATVTMNDDDARQDALTLEFANGERMCIKVASLDAVIIRHAVLHGLKQKLVDAAAIARNPDTGRSATVVDKYVAVREVYDRLLSGQWNKGRGEGSGSGAGGLLFRALCRLYANKTPEQLREFLDGKSKEEQAALRKNPRIAAIIEEIKAESAKTDGIDSDELLGELD